MTEAEWQDCTSPDDMLAFLGHRLSARKLRLFAIACCRDQWSPLYAERSRKLLELAERYADGQATPAELVEARRLAYPTGLIAALQPDAREAANRVAWALGSDERSRRERAALLREVCGNPFHHARLKAAWLAWADGAVPKLARSVYDQRQFTDLPVLADALEEAGCTDGALLEHCRGPGPHYRGCWLLDILLQKA